MVISPTPSDQIQLEDIKNMEQWALERTASAMLVDPPAKEEKSSPYSSAQSDSASGSTEVSELGGHITTDDDLTCDAQNFFHKYGPPPPYGKSERKAPKRTRVVTFDNAAKRSKTQPHAAEEALPEGERIQLNHSKVKTSVRGGAHSAAGHICDTRRGTIPAKGDPLGQEVLQKIADMSNKQRADDLPAKYIKKQAEKYCVDKRPVITAEDPPALISKLGAPTEGSGDKEGVHIPLHVRALTGCDLMGPAADRTILVHGEGLGKGVTLRETACTLAGQFLVKEEDNHPLGHLVDKIKKGARKESERDAGLREVLLLEAVSPTAA
ncbi:hypothetical protein CYMTET_40688 [Cymbomonas tetramitiformis]|uniref:Uncharacterized protein n=1 Tax=Cymbomonas tetramitiformis TaxID=36881 RepID=A0AAE0C8Y5_9CHLO|nr:hypothetical protein CYMTET_40688 [Cymbomonas tetramitiformis]